MKYPKLPDETKLLSIASSFVVATGRPKLSWYLTIERKEQQDGSFLWSVELEGCVWNRATKQFEYSRMPSSRTSSWLKTHRLKTLEEAWKEAQKALKQKLKQDKDFYGEKY